MGDIPGTKGRTLYYLSLNTPATLILKRGNTETILAQWTTAGEVEGDEVKAVYGDELILRVMYSGTMYINGRYLRLTSTEVQAKVYLPTSIKKRH